MSSPACVSLSSPSRMNIVKQITAEETHQSREEEGEVCIYFQRQTVNTAALFSPSLSVNSSTASRGLYVFLNPLCECVHIYTGFMFVCVSTVTTLTSWRSLMVYNKVTSLVDNVHRHMCFLQ